MILENKYNIGEFVYLITDPDQCKRIITGIEVGQRDICYFLACGESTTKHYDFEISKEKQLIENNG